ncbi:CDF-like metal transporter [Armillaria luteobubalina]|uniref:CDF-like metal transporter n=1 Tax=Armillaria luteobubalina TaxID=153913 RepID=A0AA39UKT6_9AGAR|nr:CDF-like metal transporter [Armillaria luteobubalina]
MDVVAWTFEHGRIEDDALGSPLALGMLQWDLLIETSLIPSRSAPKVTDIESSLSDKPVDNPFRLRAALRDPDDNEKIDAMLKTVESHAQEGEEDTKESALKFKIAVYASSIANCILSVLQLYAAISSLSLSFFATAVDSIFDPAANLLLNQLHCKAKCVDFDKYPGGGTQLTTIGNIVYSFTMLSVSILLVAFSIQDLTTHKDGETLDFYVPSVVAIGVAFGEEIISLSPIGFGILTSSAGAKLKWWIDPMGAIIISCIVIVSWTYTSYWHIVVGRNSLLDSISIIPSDMPLWKSHDLSQDLQDKLETLPMVERVFVHVDHEVSHKPEHCKYV